MTVSSCAGRLLDPCLAVSAALSAVVLFLWELTACPHASRDAATAANAANTGNNDANGAHHDDFDGHDLGKHLGRRLLDDDEFARLADDVEHQLQPSALICLGSGGSGKSSFLNTAAGAPVRGTTRGVQLSPCAGPGADNGADLVLVDTEGLPQRQRVAPHELEAYLHGIGKAVSECRAVTATVAVCLDVQAKPEAHVLANLLALVEVLRPVRAACVLVFTKWNTNSVMGEWNDALLQHARRARRASKPRPAVPQPDALLRAYLASLERRARRSSGELAALLRIRDLLDFFEDRTVWSFSLDALQLREQQQGDGLPPALQELHEAYRVELVKGLARVKSCAVGDLPMTQPDLPCLVEAAMERSDQILADQLEVCLSSA